MVAVYQLTEGEVQERERFWNDSDRVVDRVGNGYKLCVLGDLNGWVGNQLRVGITGGLEFQEKIIMVGK